MSDLIKSTQVSITNITELTQIGELMAKSGFFEDCRQVSQCAIKILAGQELGIGAFASMTGIHIIKNKPTIGANLMAALIKRSGRYNYRVVEHDDTVCKIVGYELVNGKWEQIGKSEFTAADARRAGTKNMGAYPRNMLFARAISNLIRWSMPDLFLGNTVYTPEELGSTDLSDDELMFEESQVLETKPVEKPKSAKPVASVKSNNPPIDLTDPKTIEWLDVSANQMKRVGWTVTQGKEHLKLNYGVVSRQLLTYEQLVDFTKYLMTLPSWEDKSETTVEVVESVPAQNTSDYNDEFMTLFRKYERIAYVFGLNSQDLESVLQQIEHECEIHLESKDEPIHPNQLQANIVITMAITFGRKHNLDLNKSVLANSYASFLSEQSQDVDETTASLKWAQDLSADLNVEIGDSV